MGKNQAHKAMQRTRHSGGDGTTDAEGATVAQAHPDGVDVTFHTPEWHAARLAALTTERISWDDFKKVKAEKQATEVDEERSMREYRAQLDADRAEKLSRGTNNTYLRQVLERKIKKKDKKKKAKDKGKKKKAKDKDKDKKSKDKKSKRSKKSSKAKKHKEKDSSSDSDSSSSSSGSDSPVEGGDKNQFRLSEFMQG